MRKMFFVLLCRISLLFICGASANAYSASLTASVSGTTITLNYSVPDPAAYVSEYQNVNGSTWAWVSIGGTSPTGVIVINRSPGTYQYQVTGCGQNGCGVRASISATVSSGTPPTVSALFSPSTINESGSSTFSWSTTNATSCSASGISGVSGAAGSITYFAPTSMASNQTASVTVNCTGAGGNGSASTSLNINWINDTPIISGIANQPINEDSPMSAGFTVSDEESAADSLSIVASSSNTGVIPNGNISFAGSGSNRTVNATPVANASGNSTITVTVSDGNSTASSSFVVTVNAVNDAPSISGISNQTVSANASVSPVGFTVSDIETAAASLSVTATSSNTSLIPNSNISLTNSGSSRTITTQPVSGASGSSTITVTVSDGSATSSVSYVVNVTPPPAQFTFASGTNTTGSYSISWAYAPESIKIEESVNGGAWAFITGELGPSGSQSINKTQNGTYGYRLNSCIHGGYQNGPTWVATLTCTPVDTRTITVTFPAPTVSTSLSAGQIYETGSGQANTSTLNWSSTNATSCSATNIGGVSNTSGTSIYTAPSVLTADQTVTFTVTCTGNGGSAVSAQTVTIRNVNDTPTITTVSPQSISEDGVLNPVNFSVSDEETATSSLIVSAVSSNTSVVSNGNLVIGGSGGSRTISATPTANASGVTRITLTVSDGSLSTTSYFDLTVNAVNDAPTITSLANQTLNEGATAVGQNFTIADVDNLVTNLSVTATSSDLVLVPLANITLSGSGASWNIKAQPIAHKTGNATITVSVSDGTTTSTKSFTVIVNDLPAQFTFASGTSTSGIYNVTWDFAPESVYVDERFNGGSWTNISNGETYPYGTISRTNTQNGTYDYQLRSCIHGGYQNGQTWVPTLTCTPVDTKTITVNIAPPSAIPNFNSPIQSTSADGNIALSWNSVSGATYYVVNQNNVDLAANADNGKSITSGTNFNATNKTNGTYTYKIKACNPSACTNYSAPIQVVVNLAGAVTIQTVNLNKATGITNIVWTTGTNATTYVVTASNGTDSYSQTITAPLTTATFNLTKAGTYTFTVTPHAQMFGADNVGATVSASSPTYTLNLPATVPTGLTSNNNPSLNGNINLSWTGLADASSYVVNQNGTDTSTVTSNSFNSSNNANNTYVYKIKACNVVGCGPAYSANYTINVAQTAPVSNVNAALLQNTGVTTLTWSAPPTSSMYTINNYSIQIKIGGVPSGGPVTTSSPVYVFPAVIEQGTYTYEVQACVTVGGTNYCSSPVPSNPQTPIQPDAPLLSAPLFSSSGFYSVTWSKSLWATHYKLFENSVLIQDTAEWSKIFAVLNGKTNGTYIYQVQACFVVCSPLSNLVTTTVTLNSRTTNPANGSGGSSFNFASEAPANFTYSLAKSGIPDLGDGEFIAATQGNINVSNGAAQYSIKLDLPPAIRDLKPSLSLNYNSRGGNGLMGMGWNLSGLSSITRCRTSFATEGAEAQKSNPRYSNGDRLCLDGQKLVLNNGSTIPAVDAAYWVANSEYKTEIDNFSRIKAFSADAGAHAYFKVFTKDGRTLTYGEEANSQNSRIRKPGAGDAGAIGSWLLDKVEDAYGNSYTITYLRDNANGNYYPDRMNFTPNSMVKFNYQTRNGQIPSGYDMGGYYKYPKLLQNVTTYVDVASPNDATTGVPVKQYQINYKLSATTQRDLVDTLAECGWSNGAWQCAKPLTFAWQQGEQGFSDSAPIPLSYCGGGSLPDYDTQGLGSSLSFVDLDEDGYSDGITAAGNVFWGTASGCFQQGDWVTGDLKGPGSYITSVQPFRTASGLALIIKRETNSGINRSIGLVYNINKITQAKTYMELNLVSENTDYTTVADINNDGLPDFKYMGSWHIQQNTNVPSFTGSYIGTASTYSQSYYDIDGDGIADEVDARQGNPGSGTSIVAKSSNNIDSYTFLASPAGQPVGFSMYNNPSYKLAGSQAIVSSDINGDGLRDFFYHHVDANGNGSWLFRLNMQNALLGDEMSANQIAAVPNLGYMTANHYAYSYDYDKDGKDDLIVIVPDGPNKCKSRFLLSRNFADGISFQEAKDSNGQTIISDQFGGCSEVQTAGLAGILAGDINNDGVVDKYWIRDHVAYLGKTQQPDLMTVVTDGFGAQTQLEYSTLTGDDNHGKPLYTPESVRPSFPQVPAGRGMQVVKKLSFSNSKGGFNDRFFNYTGARSDVQGRGFLGFATIQVTDVARSTTSITDYRLDFPFTGRVDSATTKSVNWDILISSVKNKYAVHSSNARFPYLESSISQNYRLTTSNPDSPISATKTQNTYDTCGNLTEQLSDTGIGVSNWTITGIAGHKRLFNELNYYGTPNNCSDDFTYRTTQETSKTSLADDFRSVVTEYTPTNSSANTVKEVYTVTSNKGTALESTTTINRNSNGLVTGSQQSAKDIDGGTTASRSVTTSNFARGIYPQTVTSVLSGGDLVTNTRYDYRFGEANYVKTPNGIATTREFDPLGRVINEYLPDMSRHELIAFDCATVTAVVCPEISGSEPSVRAAYGVATKVTNSAFANNTLGAPLTITFYDSLQRPVRSTTYTMNGNAINVDRVYTPEGNLAYVSEPFNTDSQGDGDSSKRTILDDYDELGVPHTETHPDGGVRTTHFGRWDSTLVITQTVKVVKSDGTEEDQTTRRAFNALGQVEAAYDANYVPVDYSYTSQGGLATTRVNNNYSTQVSITYDAAGNKSHMVDPDAGAIDFEYNGFGELRRQTWQKGTAYAKSMTLSYDQLGRQLSRVDQPVSGSPTTYNWMWDIQQPGLLSSESGNGQTVTYTYDNLGRPDSMTTSITGLADKIFTYTYDAFSRPATVTYPNGLSIQRVYHGNGMAVQTQDITDQANPKILWALGSDVDGRGSFTNQLWGNGVATQTAFDAVSGQLQSIKSGRLSSSNTVANLKGDIQNLNYTFDSLGNMESRTTHRTNAQGIELENTTERFSYDTLNRLKSSTTGGLFVRYNTYDYDELGNLTNRNSYLGSSSTNDDVGVLTYNANGTSIHQVSSAGGINYQYDKYGNMTQRGSENITYDVFNKPIIISNSTTTTNIFYDANHDRFKESDGSKTTYSIAGGLYEEEVSGTTSTQKSYIDGVIINTKVFNANTLASNDTQYLHTDHLGSVDAISDKFGAFVTRMSFSDWGNRQKSDWSTGMPTLNFPTQNGYTGHHEMDKHNLVHMGGRVYDPRIGRFLSADLFIQSPYNTQSFNRYTYVSNNPLSRIDPTGYEDEEVVVNGLRDRSGCDDACWSRRTDMMNQSVWESMVNAMDRAGTVGGWLEQHQNDPINSPDQPQQNFTLDGGGSAEMSSTAEESVPLGPPCTIAGDKTEEALKNLNELWKKLNNIKKMLDPSNYDSAAGNKFANGADLRKALKETFEKYKESIGGDLKKYDCAKFVNFFLKEHGFTQIKYINGTAAGWFQNAAERGSNLGSLANAVKEANAGSLVLAVLGPKAGELYGHVAIINPGEGTTIMSVTVTQAALNRGERVQGDNVGLNYAWTLKDLQNVQYYKVSQ